MELCPSMQGQAEPGWSIISSFSKTCLPVWNMHDTSVLMCRVLDRHALLAAGLGSPVGRAFSVQAGSHTHTFLAKSEQDRRVRCSLRLKAAARMLAVRPFLLDRSGREQRGPLKPSHDLLAGLRQCSACC